MNPVKILSPEIVSKIAAGEVIERPASVVKELLENSLDAGAKRIEIHLTNAGKTLIHIKDDGFGIRSEDLTAIFERHATSKITCVDDLYNINSLGFRGEALFSIAAVSDITVESKTTIQDSGFQIHQRAQTQDGIRPCASNEHGTDIKIKELFFNTPARKKFLKTNSTEINQILNLVIPYTLIHTECRFLLTHQGKTLIDLAPTKDIKNRLADALHLNKKFFLLANHTISDNNCSFSLVLGDINIKRSRRDMQFVFVNNRPVFSKSITFHLNRIYRLILPPELFGFFFVNINLDPQALDVNIHPTKREIKIEFETALCTALRSVAKQTLMTAGQIKQVSGHSPRMNVSENNFSNHSALGGPKRFDTTPDPSFIEEPKGFEASIRSYAYPLENTPKSFFVPEDIVTDDANTLPAKLKHAKYIGPFIKKFLLFESGKSLLLVDQHAAQERITYEKLIKQMQKGKIEVQPLLAPILVTLSSQEILIWEEHQKDLEKFGLSTTQFDDETIAIHAHPNLVNKPEKALKDLLTGVDSATFQHDQIARRACRSSIMTGDKLSKEQAEFQRSELLKCLDPFTCPHGRPTIIEMTEDFLDKQFLRT